MSAGLGAPAMATHRLPLAASDYKLAKFGILLDELRSEHERIQVLVRNLDADNARLDKLCQSKSTPNGKDDVEITKASTPIGQEWEVLGQEWVDRPPPAPPTLPSASNGKAGVTHETIVESDMKTYFIALNAKLDEFFVRVEKAPADIGKLNMLVPNAACDIKETRATDNDHTPTSGELHPPYKSSTATKASREGKSERGSVVSMKHELSKGAVDRVSQARSSLARVPTVSLLPETEHTKHLDLIMCFAIIANSIVMAVELEWVGYKAAVNLRIKEHQSYWDHAEITFGIFEYAFTALFAAELSYRVWTQGRTYFSTRSNYFDASLVAINIMCIVAEKSQGKWNLLKSLRVLKVGRMLRVCRIMHLLTSLRIVTATMSSAVSACVWPISVLFLFVILAGIMICSILTDVFGDEALDLDVRIWAYQLYGSSTRATYTIFEATFSGCWPNYARKMIEEISPVYAFFWLPYVTIVVFAVVRIISALFLKDMMQKASADAEIVKIEKEKKQAAYVAQLGEAFQAMDTSGDGTLSRDEVEAVMTDPQVQVNLNAMDLHHLVDHDIFGMIDNGSGEVTYDEFMKGVARLRGTARSVDLLEVLLECRKLRKVVDDMVNEQRISERKRHKT